MAAANDLAYVVQAVAPNFVWKTTAFPQAHTGWMWVIVLSVLLSQSLLLVLSGVVMSDPALVPKATDRELMNQLYGRQLSSYCSGAIDAGRAMSRAGCLPSNRLPRLKTGTRRTLAWVWRNTRLGGQLPCWSERRQVGSEGECSIRPAGRVAGCGVMSARGTVGGNDDNARITSHIDEKTRP